MADLAMFACWPEEATCESGSEGSSNIRLNMETLKCDDGDGQVFLLLRALLILKLQDPGLLQFHTYIGDNTNTLPIENRRQGKDNQEIYV
ncbi:hypothetical protein IFM46972_03474 [Aspergillus udagawae]|uniref:Uncharacterized protein n=1 Tax=Aspergillus udagawae TaxID=91492 RepID=A0A8H3RNR0_9EURO|nr:hypothetical protein IFM46972_03474 [Aspergillus udagawae]